MGWLSRIDKTLPMPNLVYVEDLDVGGCYVPPTNEPVGIDDIEIENPHGTIVVNHSRAYDPLYFKESSVLAHEWRHHWQFFNGIDDGRRKGDFDFSNYYTYESEMVKFFSNSYNEFDALRFEIKHAKSYHNEWVMALLRKHQH